MGAKVQQRWEICTLKVPQLMDFDVKTHQKTQQAARK
jgi:hypothetical protein